MKLIKKTLLFNLALLGTLAFAVTSIGCGGGDDATAEAIETSSISKEKFSEEANAICRRGDRWLLKQMQAQMLEEGAGDAKKSEQELLSDAAKVVAIPRVQAAVRDIRALGAPKGDEDRLEAFLTKLQEETEALAKDPQISSGALFGGAFKASGDMARDYGIASCAYG